MHSSVDDFQLQVSLADPQTRNTAAAIIEARYASDMRRIARQRLQGQFARRLCLDDVLQSTWRSFHGCVSALRVTDSFWPYLFVILKRKISKARQWHKAAKRDIGRETNLGDFLDSITPLRATPDMHWLRESVAELAEPYRQVIQLRLDGYSQAEIASQLGRSVKFVQRYQQSAIEMLRSQLIGDYAQHENL